MATHLSHTELRGGLPFAGSGMTRICILGHKTQEIGGTIRKEEKDFVLQCRHDSPQTRLNIDPSLRLVKLLLSHSTER